MRDAKAVLGILVKHPQAGTVKTRLAEGTSAEFAAALAEAFLRDIVERWADFPARRVLVYSPPDAAAYFENLAGGRFEQVPQVNGDLGRRMEAFFIHELQKDSQRAVVIGGDSPTLPRAHLDQAFQSLEHADVVLGPATDGGYYLVGCRGRVPPIFNNITWGGSSVLADTVARLADAGSSLALLPPWYDVDTVQDCQLLRGHIVALRRCGQDPNVPRTEQIVTSAFPLASSTHSIGHRSHSGAD